MPDLKDQFFSHFYTVKKKIQIKKSCFFFSLAIISLIFFWFLFLFFRHVFISFLPYLFSFLLQIILYIYFLLFVLILLYCHDILLLFLKSQVYFFDNKLFYSFFIYNEKKIITILFFHLS